MPRQAATVDRTAYLREFYLKRKDVYKEKHLQKAYGISLNDFIKMLEDQGYRCGICATHLAEANPKNVHIDHCHDSGVIRGVLCNSCNMGIGMLKDNVTVLKQAIVYLEKHSA